MIRKYYILEGEIEGGGGDPPAKPAAPKNYKTTTPQQRDQWNNFLEYANQQKGVDFDKDPKAGINLMNQYRKQDPTFSITPDLLPAIKYEQYQIRKGDAFGSLKPEQLKYLRQGLPENYLNRDVDTQGDFTGKTAKLYYPMKDGYGTDIEKYVNRLNPNALKPSIAPSSDRIPLPNYDDPKARFNYLQQIRKKHGDVVQGRGDAIIHVNEVPDDGVDTMKNATVKAASKFGLDPALLYSSTMEEGGSGVFPDKNGKFDQSDSKTHPVDGFHNFGLDHFHDVFPELVKRGYLPKNFDYEKATQVNPENSEKVNSANFKTVDDAIMAKAAYVKMFQDDTEKYAKSKGVELSPKAKQFFTLIAFNGGPGTYHKMLNYYQSKGLLKDDKYMETNPGKAVDPGGAYKHIVPRFKIADILRKEALFE